jgi:hypothetical protein
MSPGRDQLRVEAHPAEVIMDEFRRAPRIGVVNGLSADARNPQQCLELLLEVAAMSIQIGIHPIDRHDC